MGCIVMREMTTAKLHSVLQLVLRLLLTFKRKFLWSFKMLELLSIGKYRPWLSRWVVPFCCNCILYVYGMIWVLLDQCPNCPGTRWFSNPWWVVRGFTQCLSCWSWCLGCQAKVILCWFRLLFLSPHNNIKPKASRNTWICAKALLYMVG